MGINIRSGRPTLQCDCCRQEVATIRRVTVGDRVLWVCEECLSKAIGKMVDGCRHGEDNG